MLNQKTSVNQVKSRQNQNIFLCHLHHHHYHSCQSRVLILIEKQVNHGEITG